jgi:hypothetical protein
MSRWTQIGCSQSIETLSDESVYNQYQSRYHEVLSSLHNTLLNTASTKLIDLTGWVVDNISLLGLSNDEPSLHARRIEFWKNLNQLWIMFLDRVGEQSEQEVIEQNVRVFRESLVYIGDMVVLWSDSLEEYGLVDYTLGFAEETIIVKIRQLLKVLKRD